MTLQTALEAEEEIRYLDSQCIGRQETSAHSHCERVWALLKWLPREKGDT